MPKHQKVRLLCWKCLKNCGLSGFLSQPQCVSDVYARNNLGHTAVSEGNWCCQAAKSVMLYKRLWEYTYYRILTLEKLFGFNFGHFRISRDKAINKIILDPEEKFLTGHSIWIESFNTIFRSFWSISLNGYKKVWWLRYGCT